MEFMTRKEPEKEKKAWIMINLWNLQPWDTARITGDKSSHGWVRALSILRVPS